MGVLRYIRGSIMNLLNPSVSILTRIADMSVVCKKYRIYGGSQIFQSHIGSYSYVANNSQVICATIGRYCSIADNVIIGPGNHTLSNISTSPIFTEPRNALGIQWSDDTKVEPFRSVSIGNDVWIGSRAIIMGGITIGNGAVVGAGAIVTKDVPPYAIVGGVPAKVIRYRFSQEVIEKLEDIRWWDLPEDKLKSCLSIFQKENPTALDLVNAFTPQKI